MVSQQTIFASRIDASGARQQLWELKKDNKIIKEEIIKTERDSQLALNRIIGKAQIAWGIIQGVVRAAGGSITMTTRLVVSAGFGAIKVMQSVLSASSMAALMSGDFTALARLAAGMAELGLAIAALITYESDQKKLSLQLRGGTFMMSNVSSLLYAWTK